MEEQSEINERWEKVLTILHNDPEYLKALKNYGAAHSLIIKFKDSSVEECFVSGLMLEDVSDEHLNLIIQNAMKSGDSSLVSQAVNCFNRLSEETKSMLGLYLVKPAKGTKPGPTTKDTETRNFLNKKYQKIEQLGNKPLRTKQEIANQLIAKDGINSVALRKRKQRLNEREVEVRAAFIRALSKIDPDQLT